MGAIAVVYRDIPSGGEKGIRRGEMKRIVVGGREVISVRLLRGGRRYVRRLLDKEDIESIVLRGDVPPFVEDLAVDRGIHIYKGDNLKIALLPHIISDCAKDKPACTVYTISADKRCGDVVRCVSDYFRIVSVSATEKVGEDFADGIMADTGLSLRIGEVDDAVTILASGCKDDVDINMADDYGIVLKDSCGNFISIATADALSGGKGTYKALSALGLKIHKGLDKTHHLY